jgi:hypothetical protein
MVDMDTCKPMQCHMRGKLKLFSRWRFPVGGGRWAGKVWPTGFSWENVRALLRRSDGTQPRFSTLIFVHIRGKTVETWKASPDGTKEHRLEAYATLIFRTVERFLEAIPGAIRHDDATAAWRSVSVSARRRRQGRIADVSQAPRFIPSSSDRQFNWGGAGVPL